MRYILSLIFCTAISAAGQNINVDPLTGSLNVAIPLWTVKSGDLSVPVTLFHSGNGMKANDGEGNAGMMWSVSAGGAVSREVRGLPDDLVGAESIHPSDYRNGWLHADFAEQVHDFVPTGDTILSDCADEVPDFDYLSAINYARDTEPDIFSFHAPGLSGQFVFDRTKAVRTIPYQDLKFVVLRNADSLISQIEITNNVGIKYTFQATDDVTRRAVKKIPTGTVNHFATAFHYYSEKSTRFNSGWSLTKIESPAGGVITLQYSFSEETNDASWYREISGTVIDSVYSISDRVKSMQLSSITGASDAVAFSWTGGRLGVVAVTDLAYHTSKTFKLSYDFVGTTTSSGWPVKRSFLTGLVEEVNCLAFPGYTFEYYGVDLVADTTSIPFQSPYNQDLFGYYNAGGPGQPLGLYVKPDYAGENGERFRIAPATGYSMAGGVGNIDSSKIYYGSLKRISLPSGGNTTVVYEPADYFDPVANSTLWGAGVRVKKIKTSANDPVSDMVTRYRYKNANGQSSGSWTYRPMFAFGGLTVVKVPDNLGPGESIMYSRVEINATGRGLTVHEFNLPGMYPRVSDGMFEVPVSRMARPDIGMCLSPGAFKTGRHSYPFAPTTNFDFERGLPIATTEYTRDNKIVSKKLYTYQYTTTEVGTVSALRFEPFGVGFVFSKYNVLTNVNRLITTETSRTYDQGDGTNTKYVQSITTYTYNGNQMLSQVSSDNSDGNVHSESIKYAKDYPSGGTDLQSQMINSLVAANQHGTAVETVTRNGTSVTSAQLTFFNNIFGSGRILPSRIEVLGKTAGFTDSNVSGSTFVYSSNYLPASYIDSYDAVGTPLTVHDGSRNVQSRIIANKTFPVFTASNTKHTEVVYADFEPFTYSHAPEHTGILNSTESWSGRNSLTLASGNSITQIAVARGKGRYYRFSCWAKASAATHLTLRFNTGSGWVSDTVLYPASAVGKWTFIKKRVDMLSVASTATFTFQVVATGTINLDNVGYYPEAADIVATSFDPLNGATAVMSGTGVASFNEYDGMGRLRFVKNQDKDIVRVIDYHYKSLTAPKPTSHFGYTWDNGTPGVTTQSNVMFSVSESCMVGVAYAWYVDDVQQSSTSTAMTKTFPENKEYRIKLVATSVFGNSVTEVCVQPIPVILCGGSLQEGESLEVTCQELNPVRHFEIAASGPFKPGSLRYKWIQAHGLVADPNFHTITLSIETTSPVHAFTVSTAPYTSLRCMVVGTSKNQRTGVLEEVAVSVSVLLSFNSTGPC